MLSRIGAVTAVLSPSSLTKGPEWYRSYEASITYHTVKAVIDERFAKIVTERPTCLVVMKPGESLTTAEEQELHEKLSRTGFTDFTWLPSMAPGG